MQPLALAGPPRPNSRSPHTPSASPHHRCPTQPHPSTKYLPLNPSLRCCHPRKPPACIFCAAPSHDLLAFLHVCHARPRGARVYDAPITPARPTRRHPFPPCFCPPGSPPPRPLPAPLSPPSAPPLSPPLRSVRRSAAPAPPPPRSAAPLYTRKAVSRA